MLTSYQSQLSARNVGLLCYPIIDVVLPTANHFFLLYALPACVVTHHFWSRRLKSAITEEMIERRILNSLNPNEQNIARAIDDAVTHRRSLVLRQCPWKIDQIVITSTTPHAITQIYKHFPFINATTIHLDVPNAPVTLTSSRRPLVDENALVGISLFDLRKDLCENVQAILRARRFRYRSFMIVAIACAAGASATMYGLVLSLRDDALTELADDADGYEYEYNNDVVSWLQRALNSNGALLLASSCTLILIMTGTMVVPFITGSVRTQTRTLKQSILNAINSATTETHTLGSTTERSNHLLTALVNPAFAQRYASSFHRVAQLTSPSPRRWYCYVSLFGDLCWTQSRWRAIRSGRKLMTFDVD